MEEKKQPRKTHDFLLYFTVLNFVFLAIAVFTLTYNVHLLHGDIAVLQKQMRQLQSQELQEEEISPHGPRIVRAAPKPRDHRRNGVQGGYPDDDEDSGLQGDDGLSAMVNLSDVTKLLPVPLTTKCKKIIKGKTGIICVIADGKNITIDAMGRRIINGTVDPGVVTINKGSNILINGRQVPLATRRYINAYVDQRVGKFFEGAKISDGASLETFIDSKITSRLQKGIITTGGAAVGKAQIIAIAGAPGPRGPRGLRGFRGPRGYTGPRGKAGTSAVMMRDGRWVPVSGLARFGGAGGDGGISGGSAGGGRVTVGGVGGGGRNISGTGLGVAGVGGIWRGGLMGGAAGLRGFVAPNITVKPPAKLTLAAGKSLSVTARASGFPRPDTYWAKEGSSRVVFGDTLGLSKAKPKDSGTWTFTAKNAMGSRMANMDLVVATEPKFTKKSPTKVIAYRSMVTKLECAVEGHPEPTIEWKRQGGKKMAEGRHRIVQGVLYLDNPNKEDEGLYMCRATTPLGSVMAGINVVVDRFSPVKFLKLAPAAIRVKDINKPIILNCTAKGTPSPTMTWYKDGVAMPTKIIKNEDEFTAVLTIKRPSSADQGKYRCAAKTEFLKKPIGYYTQISLYECKAPEPPLNGVMVGHDFHVGSAVKYSCNPGCMLYGSAVRVCNQNGRWTGTQPLCYDVGEVAYECHHYNILDNIDRSVYSRRMMGKCDDKLAEGWYRISGDAGSRMPTSCQAPGSCNAKFPGWLFGQHPRKEDGCVMTHVCFGDYITSCCAHREPVLVRNCGKFYVYKLSPTRSCDLRYCSK